ncbi:MAG TPA: hypothetical protein VE996_05775 [Terriglobales bacterium]|nr:hypothetical protein [Terriglobales bacterium]
MEELTRRDLLKAAAATGAGAWLEAATPAAARTLQAGAGAQIVPLNSTSDVYIPPRGRSFLKFSFDFPEPSVRFADLLFSFRLYTFENVYALDPTAMEWSDHGDRGELACRRLTWAGGQAPAAGRLEAHFQRTANGVEWRAEARMEGSRLALKAISAIVRGVPRGKISPGGGGFFEPRNNELLFGYPFGGDSLFLAGGMNTPLVVIETPAGGYFALGARDQGVHAHRFYLQPGDQGYRAELTYESAGWRRSAAIASPAWRAERATTLDAAFRPHFAHVEQAFGLPDWETRGDVPDWLRRTALVIALHGMHWTGYIFNDFARMRRILEWVATQIPGDRVLVFLPAWDGRYYWNYPLYEPDPRLGGAAGFKTLIAAGHRLGFHFMPMFGSDAANDHLPTRERLADARTVLTDGDPFRLNWVDWDNDRRNEGWSPFMNLGVASWREWLTGRIAATVADYDADAYFLDIAGGWVNNTQGDMFEGERQLVAELRRRFPHVLACGEMSYDALLGSIPLFQVFSERGYPAAFKKYARAFQHLSHPAPGRGSSGVHESGFGRFNPATLDLDPEEIPTITVVDDTFDNHRDIMAAIIVAAKKRAGIAS